MDTTTTNTVSPIYRTSPLNGKRHRWTNEQLAELNGAIIAAVAEDSPVSLRGVFYRVESAGAVEKSNAGYQRVQRQLLKLRRSGSVPYTSITDGTRWITKPETWSSLDEKLEWEQENYRRSLWHDTDDEVMIFTEKDAISGVILPITSKWDVPLGVLRGYCSESFAYSVADSIIRSNRSRSGVTYVYNLGDHDPSGIDAWREFTEKVDGFVADRAPDVHNWVEFERLAVTEDQIDELSLPTRPTKKTDVRAKGFVGGSVEVDAIPAHTLRQIVDDAIEQHVDQHWLDVVQVAEESEREIFAAMRGQVAP